VIKKVFVSISTQYKLDKMSSYSPELITPCHKTQMLRLQTPMVGLNIPPTLRSFKIVKICLLIFCVISGLVGVAYLLFDPLVRALILNKLVLTPATEEFLLWENPPISPHLKVYMFNLTNPEEFFNGKSLPHVVEVGPYMYRQTWTKQNITWHDNGTISFRTRKIFRFVPEESCPSCQDTKDNITTINVPLVSAYYQSRDADWKQTYSLSGLIWTLGYKPWMTHTVHELLWGYEEPLFKVAQALLSDPPPFSQFGLFLQKNSTKEEEIGLLTMNTGKGDPYKLSTIESFKGQQYFNFWNTSECNKVHGSDGAAFNPYIKKIDTVYFFNDKLCRALPLVYNNSVVQEGLPGLRFMPREDVFMSSKRFPKENSCFDDPNVESGDGVFDVTRCQFNTPIILSWPHFLGAEEKYKNGVIGLNPDKNKHSFWFDIQEVTGTTLSAQARIQVNMKVHKIPMFDSLSRINDTVVPMMWFDEGIEKLGPKIVEVLQTAATEPQIIRHYILLCFVALTVITALIGMVLTVKVTTNRASVAKVERLRRHVENRLHMGGQTIAENESSAQLTQPMIEVDSSESSRSTTANHSRTSSEGVTPPYINIVNKDPTD